MATNDSQSAVRTGDGDLGILSGVFSRADFRGSAALRASPFRWNRVFVYSALITPGITALELKQRRNDVVLNASPGAAKGPSSKGQPQSQKHIVARPSPFRKIKK